MNEFEIFLRLLLSLGLGALIGAERERLGKEKDEFQFGGIRTFMFISLLGALSALLSKTTYDWINIAAFMGLIVVIAIGYSSSIKLSKGKSIGVTGEVSAFLVFLIGMLTLTEHLVLAVAITILVATFLFLKERLHLFLKKVSEKELLSTLIFAIITFVVLPFLPNKTFDPLGVINPFNIWLMVVFICGLSFIGYILTKLFGSGRGIGLTGLLGGMVSSTAVTMTFAARSKQDKNPASIYAIGALLANSIMFFRVLIAVFVINRQLIPVLLVPILTMGLVALLCAGFLWYIKDKKEKTKSREILYESPFNLKNAFKFGVFFAIILAVVKIAQLYLGHTGLYIASMVSGFVDVDAITLSMAGIAGKAILLRVAATAITLAVISNTVIKLGYALIFGSKEFGRKLGFSLGLAIVSGLVAILLL